MIIRVLQVWLKPGAGAAFEQLMRDEAIPLVRGERGLVALHVGTQLSRADSPTVIIVSIWRDQEALEAFMGPDWQVPLELPGEADLVLDMRLDNYMSLGN
jgi:heme-degrading monooxygenase HmoA